MSNIYQVFGFVWDLGLGLGFGGVYVEGLCPVSVRFSVTVIYVMIMVNFIIMVIIMVVSIFINLYVFFCC